MLEGAILIIRSDHGGGSRLYEALRLSAAMLGMDVQPTLVFLDKGVECLRPCKLKKTETWDYLLASTELANVYVLSDSLRERGLDIQDLDSRLELTELDLKRLSQMLADGAVMATF